MASMALSDGNYIDRPSGFIFTYLVKAVARFKMGDSVHVNKFKTIFEKDYTPNWTTEVFRIVKV